MQTSTKIAATGGAALAACAACCAVSIVPSAIAGVGFAAVGGAVAAWGVPALLLAVPIGMYLMIRKPSTSKEVPATSAIGTPLSSGCGCGPSCDSTKESSPIACTLDAGDFKARTASIRDLARRSLLKSSRGRLTLSLVYAADAADEVAELVAKERACCAFLDFDRTIRADGVHLVITAPESAAEAADMLFDHFSPDLAHAIDQKEPA
ncbi:hypothetical protein [Rhizobium sp. FKL33]|uniref:hypothetical protein n=1 Tax=Rhizobium sp. FKL33 TaxID=2562307 RepID=UPI001FED4152|nr:hypothetical protein [Rhizobium sp. FKL33]